MGGGYYAYYEELLPQALCEKVLGLRDADGNEVSNFPAEVYDVTDALLGIAHNKEEVITLWNSNGPNRAIGKLSGYYGPFAFLLRYNCQNDSPDFIGIGSMQDAEEFDWIDFDDTLVLDHDDTSISIE